jgi:hypothetical protein
MLSTGATVAMVSEFNLETLNEGDESNVDYHAEEDAGTSAFKILEMLPKLGSHQLLAN